jgi:hypothetical protein
MHDEESPNFTKYICARMHDHFSEKWIGRCDIHEWPPQPDVTPCDIFLCGEGGKEICLSHETKEPERTA